MSVESNTSFVAYLKDVEKVKELVAQSSSESQLRELLAASFSYFHLDWDESPETQSDGDEIADIFGDKTMFRNANSNWITVSIDLNAQF